MWRRRGAGSGAAGRAMRVGAATACGRDYYPGPTDRVRSTAGGKRRCLTDDVMMTVIDRYTPYAIVRAGRAPVGASD